MYKNILNLGVVLNREEQVKIMGGTAPDCEPGEILNPTICIGENCP